MKLKAKIKDYNIDVIFKIAWAKLLHLKKIIYIIIKLKNIILIDMYIIWYNILFAKID